jgi:steroid delta-isomerase-like uncharacterized protein
MGTSENKAIYRRFIDEAFNSANFGNFRDLLTPDYQVREPPPGAPQGAEAVRFVVRMFHEAFPDLHITLDEVIAEGDTVCASSTLTGTHKGAFMGYQPTGKKVTMTSLTLVHIRDGKVSDSLVKNDVQALMRQIGAQPAGARA